LSRNSLIAVIFFIAAVAGIAIWQLSPAPQSGPVTGGGTTTAGGQTGQTGANGQTQPEVMDLRVAGGQWRLNCPETGGAAAPAPDADDAADEDAASTAAGGNTSEPKRCRIGYRITTAEAEPKFLAAALFVYAGAEQKPVLILTFRPQAKLDQDVFLRVDNQQPTKLPRGRCNDKYCAVEVQLTADGVNMLKQGNTMYISWVNGQGQRVRAPVALATFAPRLEELARAGQ